MGVSVGVQCYSANTIIYWALLAFLQKQITPYSVKHKHDKKCTSPPFALLCHPLNIEKGGAVPYRDLVTILRLASMQYITKLATTQSQNPWSTLPQNKVTLGNVYCDLSLSLVSPYCLVKECPRADCCGWDAGAPLFQSPQHRQLNMFRTHFVVI